MRSWKRLLGSAAFAGLILSMAGPSPALAKAKGDETAAEKVMYTTGSVLCSVVYCPVKTIYSIGGHLVGGTAYILTAGDKEASWKIFDNAVKGDYFVLPSHLKGEKKLKFNGEPRYGK